MQTDHTSSSDQVINFVLQCLHPGAELRLACLLFRYNHSVYSVVFIYICIIYTLFYLYLFYSQGPRHNET